MSEGNSERPGRRWLPHGWGYPPSPGEVRTVDLAAVVLLALAVWFHADVAPRAQVVGGRSHMHRTDFTVFTEAASAFFDGRDPYAVTNPRGWYYLYPPLFALMVAPLTPLDAAGQVLVWYAVSVALGFGAFAEARKLWRLALAESDGPAPSTATLWVVASGAALTVALPTLECLQRGQLGIALLYALLLGFRLAAEGRRVFLGGIVLAWAAVVKLIPALPVGFLCWQAWVAVARRREGPGRASALAFGVVAGGVLFLVAAPSVVLGWDANARHLRTWARKVVTNADPGRESKFHIDSPTNQSLSNAAHTLAVTLRPEGPDDPRALARRFARTPEELRFGVDAASALMRKADAATRRAVLAAEGLVLVALLALSVAPRAGPDLAGRASAFGLACLGMILVSPVAWTHYYMMFVPAVPFVPLRLASRGRTKSAWAAAAVPAALVWAHYLGKSWAGPVGLLGLGTAVWFAAAWAVTVIGPVVAAKLPGRRADDPREPPHPRPRRLRAFFPVTSDPASPRPRRTTRRPRTP